MAGQLEGKTAVITGGAAGIGLATTELFVKEGATVIVGDLQPPTDDTLAARYGERLEFLRTDVLNEADVRALIEHAAGKSGRLDVLFNNAGYGGTIAALEALDMSSVDTSIAVLLKGVIHGYKYASAVMKPQRSGSIISTASIAAQIGGGGPVIYSACKAAVAHLAKCAALELAPYRVRSNAICPGAIATQLLARAFGLSKAEAPAFAALMNQRAEEGHPIPRIGRPEDIAQLALFLAGPNSGFITGQAIAVDGGYTVNPAFDFGQNEAVAALLAEFRAAP